MLGSLKPYLVLEAIEANCIGPRANQWPVFKNITTVNDAYRVLSERHNILEHHLQVSITLLESSVVFL
jgi:hypothetical protein